MAAAAVPQTGYPIKLNRNGTVTFDTRKLENHLIQQLSYNQTESSTLVDEITSLVREDNKPVLLTAVERKATHLVNDILQSVDPSERLRFIQIQADGVGGLYNISRYNLETYRQILQSVSSDDERLQLLQTKYGFGRAVLHRAAINSATEIVKVILESVSEEMRYTLLSMEDNDKRTPIHMACMFGNSEVSEMMMRLITVEMRYKLLQLPALYGLTPLHWSAGSGSTQCIRVIADSVSSQQLIHLLRITDSYGRTPLQLAAEANNNQATVELLQDYQTKALIDVALQQTEQSVLDQHICEIIEHEPLNQGQIQELSPYSSRYVIPHNQTKTKRYGLILYNSEDRHGADEEAGNFEQALETAGCDVIKLQWSVTSELRSMIDSSLTRIVGDCSLLIVAVMTHGYSGVFAGSDGSEIPIDDVLYQIEQRLRIEVPLVFVAQTCQVFLTHAPVEHIVLRRPHTVLLLATLTGGLAIRGAFTGALADQIRASDGKTDIYRMFNSAADNMIRFNPACANQRPEMRISTQKVLVLPPAVNNVASGGALVEPCK